MLNKVKEREQISFSGHSLSWDMKKKRESRKGFGMKDDLVFYEW